MCLNCLVAAALMQERLRNAQTVCPQCKEGEKLCVTLPNRITSDTADKGTEVYFHITPPLPDIIAGGSIWGTVRAKVCTATMIWSQPDPREIVNQLIDKMSIHMPLEKLLQGDVSEVHTGNLADFLSSIRYNPDEDQHPEEPKEPKG